MQFNIQQPKLQYHTFETTPRVAETLLNDAVDPGWQLAATAPSADANKIVSVIVRVKPQGEVIHVDPAH